VAEASSVLLFLHVPKTAGTTLARLLYSESEASSTARGDEWLVESKAHYFHGMLTLADSALAQFMRTGNAPSPDVVEAMNRDDVHTIAGHFSFGLHRLLRRPARYVTFLRDPVDRMISLYHHVREYPDAAGFPRGLLMDDLSLERFATDLHLEETDNDQTRRVSGLDPPAGQCSESMLEAARENIREHFLLVGTSERFDESWLLLCRRLSWSPRLYVPSLVNRGRPDRNDIPAGVGETIAERNSLDLALYEYATSLLDEAIEEQGESFRAEAAKFHRENAEHVERHRWW
jgi:Galactose-3-O-sulfotransferase